MDANMFNIKIAKLYGCQYYSCLTLAKRVSIYAECVKCVYFHTKQFYKFFLYMCIS